jgi:AcrR family transcriptional regulator
MADMEHKSFGTEADHPSASSQRRAIGRPRDARADRAIVEATLELIAEQGVDELCVDDVARRAGVGKAAIYRRYRSKEELVADAVAGLVSEIEVPDAGSTRGDLLELMRQAVAVYSDPIAAGVMPGLLGAVGRDPQLASALRDGFLTGRRAALVEVLERGIRRGDLRRDLDLELALDTLGGALFYRLLVTGGPIDQRLANGVVELILRGFAPSKRRP